MTTTNTTTTTTTTIAAHPGARTLPLTPAWVGGGMVWTVAGLAGLGAEEGSARFVASIVLFLASQLALFVGLVALRRAHPWGGQRLGTVGWGVALVGRVAFVVAEVVTLATGELAEAIYPIGAMLTALGMIALGVAVVRARRLTGAARLVPLAFGAYPFVFMFPVVAAGGTPDVTIALWGLLAVAVGLVAPAAEARVAR